MQPVIWTFGSLSYKHYFMSLLRTYSKRKHVEKSRATISRVWGNVYPIWKLLDHIAKAYLSATYSRVSSLLVQHQSTNLIL